MYSDRIHKCSKLLFVWSVMKKHGLELSFQERWKLCTYLEKFHTDKNYGITYGEYGVMSMEGFIKVNLSYSQLSRNSEKCSGTDPKATTTAFAGVLLPFSELRDG